jgi:hypothetical protein
VTGRKFRRQNRTGTQSGQIGAKQTLVMAIREWAGQMKERYRGFYLCGGAEPVLETLLGHITQWFPTGSIDYVRPRGSVVELARFRLPTMTVDDKVVATWFGLELARLFIDSSYRDFVIARYETEKQLVKRDRSRK